MNRILLAPPTMILTVTGVITATTTATRAATVATAKAPSRRASLAGGQSPHRYALHRATNHRLRCLI
eukprot:4117-Prymnesium_polylepis.1